MSLEELNDCNINEEKTCQGCEKEFENLSKFLRHVNHHYNKACFSAHDSKEIENLTSEIINS